MAEVRGTQNLILLRKVVMTCLSKHKPHSKASSEEEYQSSYFVLMRDGWLFFIFMGNSFFLQYKVLMTFHVRTSLWAVFGTGARTGLCSGVKVLTLEFFPRLNPLLDTKILLL